MTTTMSQRTNSEREERYRELKLKLKKQKSLIILINLEYCKRFQGMTKSYELLKELVVENISTDNYFFQLNTLTGITTR